MASEHDTGGQDFLDPVARLISRLLLGPMTRLRYGIVLAVIGAALTSQYIGIDRLREVTLLVGFAAGLVAIAFVVLVVALAERQRR